MRIITMLAMVLALSMTPLAIARSKPRKQSPVSTPAAAPQIEVVRLPDGQRADLAFDGPLLGWALPRARGGHRALFLLVGPKREASDSGAVPACAVRDTVRGAARNARLFRWRPESPDRLDSSGSGLPEGALESADLDGDGEDELLLQRDGGIDLVAPSSEGSAETRGVVEDAQLGRSCCGPRAAWDGAAAQDTALRIALVGAFRTYRRVRAGEMAVVSELAIPERVSADSARARIESPAVRPIGRTKAGRMIFATEPEAVGRRRLRTLLLDPDGPTTTQVVESWSLFPDPERSVDSAFALLDGAPVLVVTTTSAEKLSIFGEKSLRVYPLGGNRTRAGDGPIFAATTGINLWQGVNPAVVDIDRDGRDDLVLAYWKGLKNAIAALEVYRGDAASGFAKPRTMSLEVEGGEKSYIEFGADADGDGRPDLILLANNEILVFPGADPARAAEKPVETRPSRRVALPSDLPRAGWNMLSVGTGGFQVSRSTGGLGRPHLLDLDGDGRPEFLFAGDDAGGRGRVSIVILRGP